MPDAFGLDGLEHRFDLGVVVAIATPAHGRDEAGGGNEAAVALELLLQEYVSRFRINDISRPVHAFWKSVLKDTDGLCKLIRDTPLTVKAWDKQKLILANPADNDQLKLGFATFFSTARTDPVS